jgi:hypothetical protein
MFSLFKSLFARVRLQPWTCLITDKADLEFVGMVLGSSIDFWFRSGDSLFSVQIPRRSPFRIVDEAYLGKLQWALKNSSRAWKTFRTPFIRELEDTILFHGVENADRSSYLIITGDECIEFVSPEPKFAEFPLSKLPEVADKVSQFFSGY